MQSCPSLPQHPKHTRKNLVREQSHLQVFDLHGSSECFSRHSLDLVFAEITADGQEGTEKDSDGYSKCKHSLQSPNCRGGNFRRTKVICRIKLISGLLSNSYSAISVHPAQTQIATVSDSGGSTFTSLIYLQGAIVTSTSFIASCCSPHFSHSSVQHQVNSFIVFLRSN